MVASRKTFRGRYAALRSSATATWLLARPGHAAIVDTETTALDGRICEICVIDSSGRVLLDTLVNPEVPIDPAARAVHGISDAMVAGAPTWPEVAPAFTAAVRGRRLLAYNAPFDRDRILEEFARAGLQPPAAIAGADRWWCVMRARAAVEGSRWKRLNGGHRARGDVAATLAVLRALSFPAAVLS